MESLRLNVEGMTCVNCARAIEISLKNLKGISKVSVSFELGRVLVDYDPNFVSEEDIKRIIEDLGYRVVSVRSPKSFEKPILIFCVVSSLTIMVLMFIPFHQTLLFQLILATLVQGIGGYKFYRSAYHSLKAKVGNMDVLVSLGSTSAYFYSLLAWLKVLPGEPFFETSAFLITFVRIGKYLEERSKGKALALLKELYALQTSKVIVLTPKGEKEVLVRDLLPGDIILLKQGAIVPVDGKVLKGEVEVDESLITGESRPLLKKEGAELLSGSLVVSGVATMKVEKGVNQSFLAMLLKQIEEAIQLKPQSQRLADQISHYFVQVVILLAVLVFIYWYIISNEPLKSFNFALAVLVISCPCAFGIAIPLALSIGLIRCYKNGAVVKNPSALERANKVKAIILDKTGTLTEGKPRIVAFKVYKEKDSVLNLALSIASLSSHPYSKAIAKFAEENGGKKSYTFEEVKEIPGYGIKADDYFLGRTETGERVVLKENDEILAEFVPEDEIRREAKEVIDYFKTKGIKTFLLSGDAPERIEKVALELGIEHYVGGVKPEEKLAYLQRIEKEHGFCAMVGDGLNDAPALAKAYLSFVMGEGVDLSKRIGDVVLLSGIKGLKRFFQMAEKTSQRIKQNLFWAFIYNLLGIPIAAGALSGWGVYLKPEFAGLMMVFSSLSVVLNSIRK
jgi:Cu2+-exporting ATPase/Cu+-exporting ATPase